jgi:ribosomal protein L12E/L44/L45/RPP1/RPP2
MRYFTQLLRQSGAMIGARGSGESAGMRMSRRPFAVGGSLLAGPEDSEPLIREVDEERIVARQAGEVADTQPFTAVARSTENVEMRDASVAASTAPSTNPSASAAADAASAPPALAKAHVSRAAPERMPEAPARRQIETENTSDYGGEVKGIDLMGAFIERERSLDAREQELAHALADVRAWVSTTPSADDVDALVEWDARKLNAEGLTLARDAFVQSPGAMPTNAVNQDLHLTIGTIEVIMEEPPAAPIAALSPPRPVGTQRTDATSMSRRLARHHLRG